MRSRRKKDIHKNIQKPSYEYVFPQDEMLAKLDIITISQIKALEDYPRVPFPTQEEIELDILIHCEKIKTTIGVDRLTNDYERYVELAQKAYPEAYLHNLKRYADEGHEIQKKLLDQVGWKAYYTILRDATIGVLKAQVSANGR